MVKLITIDDESDFTEMIRSYFSLRGYEVFVANNGDAGLALIEEHKPDVALLDLKMPGKSGDQVLIELKTISPRTLPIMITACEGDDKVRDKLILLGALEVFDKPLQSLKSVESKIKELLNK